MSDLSIFVFESQEIRFVGTPEKPEWVAADVCAILEIKNPSDALGSFDEDERGLANVYTPGDDNPQGQEMLTVTEAGLYRLIFKSRKPVAKRFQRWVFHEVLPSLRRTGKYEMPKPTQQHNAKPTLDELVSFGQKVLAGTRLSAELQTITILRGVQALCPEIAPMAQELVGAIQEIEATHDRHLPPTELGKIYAQRNGLPKPVSPQVVNQVLEFAGLQRKEVEIKTDTQGKQKRKNIWHLTDEGKQWGVVTRDKARTHGKIVEHVRWLPDILDVIDLSIQG
ncbi:prophage antirepressor [Nostoc commune NIES-4072]|uniref:Prophage antirepressor n=1 Tax=Nostoc commune NIES-4072 TaxID=2005467 RepID=A0A2R5FZC6_NOSCO|nr:BRO family protein [Nostoc commune]BBD70755.1 prophage antirepressor [Nostoc commune HK-02]GBG23409.1 prophage antirepressor [Nostoc commune NIES-4072]